MRTDGKRSVCAGIVERVKREIALGIITEGERLPSCRELAMEMGINPNTVQRAYAALEEAGFLVTVPKKGVYARGGRGDPELEAKSTLASLRAAGFSRPEIEAFLDEIYAEDSHDRGDGAL